MKPTILPVLTLFSCLTIVAAAPAKPIAADRIRVPDGFEAFHYADADLANDIYSMTVDAHGRVAVAGRGYIRLLIDRDGDGRADEARQFSDVPASGAQGMYFDGNDLLCTGDGALLRFRDADGDGRADGPPERLLSIKTGGEHDTHAIRKGPDGWWYVLAGNKAGVDARFASLPSSPITNPSAGVLYRLTPDFRKSEIVADGFRNPYDFSFNGQGDLFVYDSDGERFVSLPWYQPTRVFHTLPGTSAGWMSLCWIRPDYFPDMPPVIARFGRGSPTGVECYRHSQFPPTYRGAVFVADWTFGRVLALPLVPDGSTYRSEPLEFMTGVGTFGFAPTDLAVAPDGSLLVSVGGRGTRGSVYRVRYAGEAPDGRQPRRGDAPMRCLTALQPLASWSRAAWGPLADEVGRDAIAEAALDKTRAAAERVRAIEILVERFGGLSPGELMQLSRDRSTNVVARAAWSLRYGRALDSEAGEDVATAFLQKRNPLVARFALQALLGDDPVSDLPSIRPSLTRLLDNDDRYVRLTAARVAAELSTDALAEVVDAARESSARSHLAALYAQALSHRIDRAGALQFATEAMTNNGPSTQTRLDAARIAQLALGDAGGSAGMAEVFEGYTGPLSDELSSDNLSGELRAALDGLSAAYPTGAREVDIELARALAIAGPADSRLLERVLRQITSSSHPVHDIHHLIVAARLPAPRSEQQRERIAQALVQIQPKIHRRGLTQDLYWEPRMGELYERLTEQDGQLPAAIAARADFGGPGSLLFLREMRGKTWAAALQKIVGRVREDDNYPWSSELVFALADSGLPKYMALVRSRIDDYRVRNAVLMALAEQPAEADRSNFVTGLDSSAYEVIASCLTALARLAPSDDPREQAKLIKLARRLGTDDRDVRLRDQAIRLLRRNTGAAFGYEFGSGDPQSAVTDKWTEWLAVHHPELAAQQLGGDSEELAALVERLDGVDWDAGDASRGKQLFATRSCAQCHDGRGAVGPDLAGVTRRFSRDDVFTAIALPSRDVSSRYATMSIETMSGKTHTGLVIYESVDGVTLRNALNQTIRIEADEIESKRTVNVSLMPQGLLDGLASEDLADLFAYLATL